MNERFKELAKQSGLGIDGYGDPIWGCLSADEKTIFLEKFSVLIVEECVKMCHDQAMAIFSRGPKKDWAKANELDNMGVKFTKHFGLEQ